MTNFPLKIIGRLLTGMKTYTESLTINDKLFEFTWSIKTFYNVLHKPNGLGVDVTIKNITIDGIPITDSYKRDFTSDTAVGKMEKVIVLTIKSKINSRIHKISKEVDVEYLEFSFEE